MLGSLLGITYPSRAYLKIILEADFIMDLKIEEARNIYYHWQGRDLADVFHSSTFKTVHLGKCVL